MSDDIFGTYIVHNSGLCSNLYTNIDVEYMTQS